MQTKVKTNRGAGFPAPRKHDPKWKDSTATERQTKRRAQLAEIAQRAGWESWSAYETAVLNGKVQIPKKPPAE